MAGHFIVCGMGRVGYRVIEVLWRLAENVSIVTQPTREEWLREARERGCTVLIGDARDEALLVEAGLDSAKGLIVTTENDLVNTEIALDAKRLCPELPVVIRIFDQTLAEQLEKSFDIRRALAMSALAAPTFAAAALGERVIASFRLETRLFVIGSLKFEDDSHPPAELLKQVDRGRAATIAVRSGEGPWRDPCDGELPKAPVDRIAVLAERTDWDRILGGSDRPESGDARNRDRAELARHVLLPSHWYQFVAQLWTSTPIPLRAVFIVLNALIVLSVFVFHFGMSLSFVDAIYFITATVTTTGYGDISAHAAPTALKLYACLVMILGSATMATLFSIITDFIVTSRFLQLVGRQKMPHDGHFVVIGLGAVGFRIVEKLHLVGVRAIAIDKNPNGDLVEAVRGQTPVIIGDGRMRDTLNKAGASRARAVIAVTGDDAVNLGAALETRAMNPEVRTVVRLFDSSFADKVKSALNIDAAMGAFAIGAPTFAAAAMYPNVRSAFILDERLFVVLHRQVAGWHGRTPNSIAEQENVRILFRRAPADRSYTAVQEDHPLSRDDLIIAVTWKELVR